MVFASRSGILLARPRLIVHNATIDLIRPILASTATKLDAEVRWAGDSLVLPQANVQLHLESYPPRAERLAAGGHRRPTKLHRLATLAARAHRALRRTEVPRNPRGFSFLAVGIVMASWPFYLMIRDSDTVAQTLKEMLRM